MARFQQIKVCDSVLRGTAERNCNGECIGLRWLRVNKGTSDDPQIRCRLEAQEFANGDLLDDLFAGTPPLLCS